MSLAEYFLDDEQIEFLSVCARTIDRPTKYASNPVFSGGTWDADKNYAFLADIGGGNSELFYVGINSSAAFAVCKATSADNGDSFTRPNLGLVTYGGNANNNIIRTDWYFLTGGEYDAGATPKYIVCGSGKNGSAEIGVRIWSSADGLSWTNDKEMQVSAYGQGEYREGKSILRRADGRYLVYTSGLHHVERRSLGVYVSDSTNLAGDWTFHGIRLSAQNQDNQFYTIAAFSLGPIYVGQVEIYSKTTEQIRIALAVSRNGLDWRIIDEGWLPVGTPGAWDDEMIFHHGKPLTVGNSWRFYYTGSAANHAAALLRNSQIGYASIGVGRIGGVGSTGYVRTRPLTIPAGESLHINASAAGGLVRVRVMEAVRPFTLTGYRAAECTPITSDTYGSEVAWGEASVPTETPIRLEFHLTDATLHSYWTA